VDHLDDGCQYGMSTRDRSAGTAGKEQERWPQPFPLVIAAVVDQILHEREKTPELVLEDLFSFCKFFPNWSEELSKRVPGVLCVEHSSPHHIHPSPPPS